MKTTSRDQWIMEVALELERHGWPEQKAAEQAVALAADYFDEDPSLTAMDAVQNELTAI